MLWRGRFPVEKFLQRPHGLTAWRGKIRVAGQDQAGVVGGGQGPRPVRLSDVRLAVVRSDEEKASLPIDWANFEPLRLNVPNGPWGNRPDPGLHVFMSREVPPHVVIYRRKRA